MLIQIIGVGKLKEKYLIRLFDEVMRRAQQRMSFGRMTLPHQLMRLVLVEQIYRAVKINRGEP